MYKLFTVTNGILTSISYNEDEAMKGFSPTGPRTVEQTIERWCKSKPFGEEADLIIVARADLLPLGGQNIGCLKWAGEAIAVDLERLKDLRKGEINVELSAKLAPTDWTVTRAQEVKSAKPAPERDELRSFAGALKAKIDKWPAKDAEGLAALDVRANWPV